MIPITIGSEQLRRFAEVSGDVNPLHMDPMYARATPYGQPVAHGVLVALKCLAQLPDRTDRLARLEVAFFAPVFPGLLYSLEITNSADESVELVLVDGRRRVLAMTCTFRHPAPDQQTARKPACLAVGRRTASRELETDQMPIGIQHQSPYSCASADLRVFMQELGLLGRGVDDFHVQTLAWCSYSIGMELPGTSALLSRLSISFQEEAPREPTEGIGRWEITEHHSSRNLLDLRGRYAESVESSVWASAEARAWVRPAPADPPSISIVAETGDSGGLRGMIAVVVGGSRGLGAATVAALVLHGATVYLVHQHSTEATARLRKGLGGRGEQIIVVQGDCADPQFCRDLAARISASHGSLDALVLNAAPALHEQDPDVDGGQRLISYVDRALSMVTSPLAELGDLVEENSGSFIWVSSSAVVEPVDGWAHYVTAKTAVEGLARSVLSRYPSTRSLVVRPPRLQTTLTSLSLQDSAMPPGVVAAAIARWLSSPDGDAPALTVMDRFASENYPSDYSEETVGDQDGADSPRQHSAALQIVATFTADPVIPVLEWWMDKLDLQLVPRLSPYAQVLQELLKPDSAMATNHGGVNVILVRPTDWAREAHDELIDDLAAAVNASVGRSSIPHVVIVCPSTDNVNAMSTFFQERLQERLAVVDSAYVISAGHFGPYYIKAEHYDSSRDHLGHLPYTPEGFAGLATLIARMVRAIMRAPAKMLVLDADNTLWDGVCGEDGPEGVRMDAARMDLQHWALDLRARGILLGLASKNAEADVQAVMRRPEMAIRTEHFDADRVNWSPKSASIREMAEEVGFSLDTIVFIDDNPSEIGEVSAHLPQVLSLR